MTGRPPAGPALPTPEVVIGLHMIVKDEAEVVERALASILPGVARVVVHDTGSEDETVALVERALSAWTVDDGALDRAYSVSTQHWPADFGAARQRALDELLGLYPEVTHVLWADADDVLVNAEHLPAWAALLPPEAAGFMAHYAYGFDGSGNLACSHYRERLVKREAIDRWVGPIHETLSSQPDLPYLPLPVPEESQLRRTNPNWPAAPNGVEWRHYPTGGAADLGRNRAILEAQAEEAIAKGEKVEPRTLFYLGQEYAVQAAMAEDEDDRIAHLRRAIETLDSYPSEPWSDEAYQARHRSADLRRALGDFDGALAIDRANAERQPEWPDSWHGMAESYLGLGKPQLALDYTDLGLRRPYPHTAMILNPTDYSVAPVRMRVVARRALGDLDGALAAARELAELVPNDPAAHQLIGGVQEEANRARTKDALLALDEALARHDENLKAYRVLDAAPYFLANDPEVCARRVRRHSGVRHVLGEPGRLSRYYGAENPHIPITVALGLGEDDDVRAGIARFCDALPRAQFLLAGLREQAAEAGDEDLSRLALLDLGCNDAWLGIWLVAEHGLGRYRGVDLNPASLDGARALLAESYEPEVGERIDLVVGEILGWRSPKGLRYDAVSCFEVVEHVPDPDDLAVQLGGFARSDGRVYVSTPSGAFERGHVADWDSPAPRGHVRAMRPQDLASLALDHGVLTGLHDGQDGVVCAAWRPLRRRGRVDLYLGAAGGHWRPQDPAERGLGGSETMAVRMAGRMADRGWRVRVYGATDPSASGGAEFLPWWAFDPGDVRDVLVSSRIPDLAAEDPRGRRVLWLHDAEYRGLADHVEGWDDVWLVGEWQREQLLAGLSNPDRSRWLVMPNGIPLAAFADGDRTFKDREPWVVYSSSPDRGLVNLLRMWPAVYELARAVGVEPQLHIAYGFTPTFEAMERTSPALREVRREVEESFSMPGVVWRGSMGQRDLRDLQQKARVWAYPTDFPEVSCITAMEAQAAGLAVLTTDVAELPATVGGVQEETFSAFSKWAPDDRARYIETLARLLLDRADWQGNHLRSRAAAPRFDLARVADLWHDRLLKLTGQRADTTDVRPTDPRSVPAWTP